VRDSEWRERDESRSRVIRPREGNRPMGQRPVSEHVRSLVARQVEDHALVVWYDPEGHYRAVAAALGLPGAEVALYEDSFFALRHGIDRLLDGVAPPRLVVYVPLERSRCHNALIELEAGGVVMQPGQQPPARNTRLSVVARNALRPVLGDDRAGGVEKQIEAGKFNLAELDALAEKGGEIASVVSVVFGTGNPQEVALAFLDSDRKDAEVVKKSAQGDLLTLLGRAFDAELPAGEALAAGRERLARHVLATDLLAALPAVPPRLAAVKAAATPAGREACVQLARAWRLRRDVRDSYVAAAHRVEQELRLDEAPLAAEGILSVETFLAVERALLRHVEQRLLEKATPELLALAESRLARFWPEVTPAVQARWALVAAAAHVLLEAERVGQALKKPPASPVALVQAYTEGDRPLCLLDSHHRHMESRWCNLEPGPGDEHQGLEKLVVQAGQRYMEVGSALAAHFVRRYHQAKPPLAGLLRQVEVFEKLVLPRLAEGKTAYVWVDGLRYEMARELAQVLTADFDVDLQTALGTPPTITEVGMAALLPKAHESARVVAVGGGKLAVEIEGRPIRDRKDRVQFLREQAGVPFYECKLDDLLPRPGKREREGLRDARLVLVTSQEIDALCEQDNLTQARRQMDGVLNDLRRGLRVLAEAGVRHVVVAADHGHLFGDELGEDMKIDAPGGDTADLHRRVWVGRGGAADDAYLRAPLRALGVESDLDLATPWTFACFRAKGGARAYFHGGLSPQELIVPVAVLTSKSRPAGGGPGGIDWTLTPGGKKLSTRFFSVQVAGKAKHLFPIEPPRVRVEIRAKGRCVSAPVSASHGFEEATGDVRLRAEDDDPRAFTPNTVTLMIVDEPGQKTVSAHLLDAATGAELAALDRIEVAISL
jgi:hypothetical protein